MDRRSGGHEARQVRQVEVLQGASTARGFNEVRRTLGTPELITLGGLEAAAQAAKNFRPWRALGASKFAMGSTL